MDTLDSMSNVLLIPAKQGADVSEAVDILNQQLDDMYQMKVTLDGLILLGDGIDQRFEGGTFTTYAS